MSERGYACIRCGCRRFTVCAEGEAGDLECCGCGRWYYIEQVRPSRVPTGLHEGVYAEMACEAKGGVKRGRPLLSEVDKTYKATRPWEKEVPPVSERTWYRRREKRDDQG